MRRHLVFSVLATGVAFAADGPPPYPIVDTGQAACYDNRGEVTAPKPGQPFFGQDAQFLGRQPSYTLNGDGLTVVDNVTGLTWQRSPDTDGDHALTRKDKLTLAQAKARPATLNAARFGGFGNWRLPNAKELQRIVDYGRSPETTGSAAIDPVFTCTRITNEIAQADYPFYWTSTTHASAAAGGAAVYVAFGRAAGWPTGMPGRGDGPGRGGARRWRRDTGEVCSVSANRRWISKPSSSLKVGAVMLAGAAGGDAAAFEPGWVMRLQGLPCACSSSKTNPICS